MKINNKTVSKFDTGSVNHISVQRMLRLACDQKLSVLLAFWTVDYNPQQHHTIITSANQVDTSDMFLVYFQHIGKDDYGLGDGCVPCTGSIFVIDTDGNGKHCSPASSGCVSGLFERVDSFYNIKPFHFFSRLSYNPQRNLLGLLYAPESSLLVEDPDPFEPSGWVSLISNLILKCTLLKKNGTRV